MKAARIHSFGPPDVVVVEDVPMPSPGRDEVLVRVMAAGVAPWDAIIRDGKSKVSPQPRLTLGQFQLFISRFSFDGRIFRPENRCTF